MRGVGLEHPRLAGGLEAVHAAAGQRLRRERMRQPACGGQNSSVGPPAVWMTGRPLAIASSTGMAKPSPR